MMRLREQDLKLFYLFKPEKITGSEGSRTTKYNLSDVKFRANIQPYTENNERAAKGVVISGMYVLLLTKNVKLKENDAIGQSESEAEYEIKTIQNWNAYQRIIVERL